MTMGSRPSYGLQSFASMTESNQAAREKSYIPSLSTNQRNTVCSCQGQNGGKERYDGGVALANSVQQDYFLPASRLRAEWGSLSFRRHVLCFSGTRLDWRIAEAVYLKEVIELGKHSKVQVSLHEGKLEVKKSVGVSLHYEPDEQNKFTLAFANHQQNGESFTLGSSYGITSALNLGATYRSGRSKQEQALELKFSNKGKSNSGTVTTTLKGEEKAIKLQLQHGLRGGAVLKNSLSTTAKLAGQWVVDAQLPITDRISIAQKLSTDLRSKDRIEWKAVHKRGDVMRFEAGLATDLKRERKLSAEFKLPLGRRREVQTRLVADECWKRKIRIQLKDLGEGASALKWISSFAHDAAEGSSVSIELARRFDKYHLFQIKASMQGRKPKVQLELRAPD